MNTTAAPMPSPSAATPRPMPARARRVLDLLERLPQGQLELVQPDGRLLRLPRAPSGSVDAHCVLHRWQALERTLRSGDIGLAEGYIAGEWDSPDLAALLRLCMVNRDHVQSLVYGSWWGRLGYRLRHLLQRNTRAGSARNIHAHYDLGNDFYRLWLDPGMSYSAAWFEGRTGESLRQADLQAAQQAKFRRSLEQVCLQPGQRLLEIGCGWGGLAEAAAREFGARVTGVTLSREQLAWGQRRMQQAGLADAVQLRYQDYRDLPARHAGEPFDAIVSIEMFEAVGREYWRGYFEMLRDCLKPGGLACIQTITLREDLFARYLRSTDFIQQYIFPGGLLPSAAAFEQEARRAGLVVEGRMAFGPDYAETLRRWRQSFEDRIESVRGQGFDERFVRIWTFYLAYCEAAFDTGNTDVVQFTLRRPVP
ncbi:Cyclopropane-fatty-acyl-phospholipid synthase [Delftia tsuruhatensis]|uniref:SAM-dependent methyltransferase n=1 Tax=Delftia tsuruhatensis TaxID=180282 RepID=UPI001E6A56DE|nr:cyclopropane-fatty-acyl-phospholipid synthase family protein [Delftia tsuruhatensis]CAB5711400.1 Cyclopropane-fatty-acyl-phospholipid synthase [Delftia tsuruhatensis]CAC9686774.1 Cyclopropane-fatty-acyl-phospholipid synthase [Delftia tsuruhatensis]